MATLPTEHFRDWLRDAHAMEQQAISMLDTQAGRLENYPELKAAMSNHLEQTRRQAEMLEGCLHRMGDDTSTIKDITGKLVAFGQGLTGATVSDEVVKGALASYSFEQMEIGSYRLLIAAAEVVGDHETKAVLEQILAEEEAMATWLYDNLPEITAAFLSRDAMDAEAKR